MKKAPLVYHPDDDPEVIAAKLLKHIAKNEAIIEAAKKQITHAAERLRKLNARLQKSRD